MTGDRNSRRRFLRLVGAAGAAGLAGCSGTSPGGGGQNGSGGQNGGGQNGSGGGSESGSTQASGGNGSTQSGTETGGGNKSGNSGGGSNTVHFLNDRTAHKPWEKAASEFNANHDYDVKITWLPQGTSSNEQLAKMRAAGNPPNIVFETSTDCYRDTIDGRTAPLTDVVNALGTKDPVQYQGESYLVPAVATPLTLLYRKDVVQGNPSTRKEWLKEAKRISNSTDMDGYVVPSGRTNDATSSVNQYLWNGGVDIYSGTGKNVEVTIDKGKNKKRAVATYKWMKEMNKYGPNASGWEWQDVNNALIEENLAVGVGIGGLGYLQLQANRPDLVSKFTPAPYPGYNDNQWWSYLEGMYVFKNAPNTDGAREFIKFFMQSDHYFDFITQVTPESFPPSLKLVKDKRFSNSSQIKKYQDYLKLIQSNWKRLAPVLQTGDNGKPNIVAANAYGQQLFGQSTDQLLKGGKSPEQAVNWIASHLRNMGSK